MLHFESCLGIDISDDDIRIVELRYFHNRCEVAQASTLQVPDGDALTVIRQFIQQTGTKPSRVICSIPTHMCSVKFAQLPVTKPTETARMARYEAETQIPLPLSELAWGYSVEKPLKGEKLRNVIIAAVQQNAVDKINSLFTKIDLPLHTLTVAALAEIRSLSSIIREHNGSIYIIHIGSKWMDFTIVSKGKIISCRSSHYGTDDLISAAARDMQIEESEAENLARQRSIIQYGEKSSDSDHSTAIQDWIESVAQEIRRSTFTVTSSAGGNVPETAVLTGNGAAICGLREALEQKTGLSIALGTPWTSMSLSTVVTHSKPTISAEYATATGLAMSGIERNGPVSLIPRKISVNTVIRRKITTISALGIAAIFLLIVLITGHSGINTKMIESKHLKTQITDAKKGIVSVQPGIANTTTSISRMLKNRHSDSNDPIDILSQLSINLPSSCWLSELNYDSGGSVVLKGSALSNSSVADAVYYISNAGLFDSVSLAYSNFVRNQNKSVYEFQIKCVLPRDKSTFGSKSGAGKRLVLQ